MRSLLCSFVAGLTLAMFCLAQQPENAFQIGTASNLYYTDPVLSLANTSEHELCVNSYIYSASISLSDMSKWPFIGCCSSLISPGKSHSVPAKSLVPSNFAFLADPSSIGIKMVATTPVDGKCTPFSVPGANFPATPVFANLTAGLRASVAGVPFQLTQLNSCLSVQGQPCQPELDLMTNYCGFLMANGGGVGICRDFSRDHNLSVRKIGAGYVTGGRIYCGTTCLAGTSGVVSLTAKPDAGSDFVGWSGACTGMGVCTVDLTSSDQSVTAIFWNPLFFSFFL